jgi:hypothetical protein
MRRLRLSDVNLVDHVGRRRWTPTHSATGRRTDLLQVRTTKVAVPAASTPLVCGFSRV